MWILLVLTFGVLKGVREIFKKKAMERNSVMEVLLFYVLFSFIIVAFDFKNAMGVPLKYMPGIALKALVLFGAWILSFRAVKYLPLSLYGVLDLSRVLFATLLAVLVLHEKMTLVQIIGLALVCLGLVLLKRSPKKTKTEVSMWIVVAAIFSCVLNACSGLLDKVLMKDITASQLQFWYLLFLFIFYLIYVLVTRTKIDVKSTLSNKWIYLMAILIVVADRCLFIANSYPESKITIMTLMKQAGAIVTIVAGKVIFKEKNTIHKFICAAIIIAGIVISVL